ncbi:E3 ubiquitin protein ligase [Klebsormidium nitens]|uniref:HECT-type E3 ubiquitin transferase n=1 Tax=Klebsormidium nitens TaxID=105231 RepID=A0A1Y1IH82_KLENI|nr:E3 ubiquitin protein ligase [Klebsormidium nitens]|eukprot:GAQ90225.1 E3 ubiquitin protein ligase [Klebsormidium nitens]
MFTGDFTQKKKVDLGGRRKELDRGRLLEQAKADRERRAREKLERVSATKIQAFARGRRSVSASRDQSRNSWQGQFGALGELATREALLYDSPFLPQLLFFFRLNNPTDIVRLAAACRLLLQNYSAKEPTALFFANGEAQKQLIMAQRAAKLAVTCLQAVHHNRQALLSELSSPWQASPGSLGNILLQTVLTLSGDFPWARQVLETLARADLFVYIRDILVLVGGSSKAVSSIERAALLLTSRYFEDRVGDLEGSLPARLRFAAQLVSIPFFWQRFSTFKQAAASRGLWQRSVHSLGGILPALGGALPGSPGPALPSEACLLGNLLEGAPGGLTAPQTSTEVASEFIRVGQTLMEGVPSTSYSHKAADVDGMDVESSVESAPGPSLDPALVKQLANLGDVAVLKPLVAALLSVPTDPAQPLQPPTPSEASLVGSLAWFLHSVHTLFPPLRARLFTSLAFSAQFTQRMWLYLKRCHLARQWPSMAVVGWEKQLLPEWLGWMLPLAVFCPVYSYLLMTIDDDEFYEKQRPLPLADLTILLSILKEAVWQLLWTYNSKLGSGSPLATPSDAGLFSAAATPPASTPSATASSHADLSPQAFLKHVGTVAATLLAQLNDRNARREFTQPESFHAKGIVDERFYIQARDDPDSQARELLRKAPFLVPFPARVRVYQSLLDVARSKVANWQTPWTAAEIPIRRNHIVEDGFDHLSGRPGESMRGRMRIHFINEFGEHEAGVDGGGLFKDCMEGIIKVAFDVQYGLFKETADHHLYPNPASHLVMTNGDHLRYYEFLGKILGKAMFEGILADIPFATFFLSKLQSKNNLLNDLPSLDPELYKSLIFLKHYEGDVVDLGLFFSVENNELGEMAETELIPGGKDIPVSNENKIKYIYLVANQRLNLQIRRQSAAFQEGFAQVIDPEWIQFFNEQELRILISGSKESADMDDLRENAVYGGGYDDKHPVIQAFWDVVKSLDSRQQRLFLKFVTGCSRGPLMGFKYLQPQFAIHRAAPSDQPDASVRADIVNRLPTSATCMNLLKLPPYRNKDMMKQKLLYAITAGAGFDLS